MKLEKNSMLTSLEDYKQVLDHITDDIFVVDKNHRILYMNDACRRMYGADPEKDLGKTVYDLVDAGLFSPPLAPVISKKKETVTMELISCQGRKLLATGIPIFDSDHEIEKILFITRDVSELDQLKYDVEETKKLLGHYEKEITSLQKKELLLSNVVTQNETVLNCYKTAQKIATTDANVLLTGESGVGKSLLAEYIHKVSNRSNKPFISINCATIPENILESELFGYCAGAFSGADKRGKPGLVEIADQGTLFLDEIGELPLMLQAKILQFIQEKTYIPIGGKKQKHVDVRIITATNRDLPQYVNEHKFREDLYYRLNVIEITLHPLRERPDDIPILCEHLIAKITSRYKRFGVLDPETINTFQKYSWPGNIRELEHVLERLILTVDNDIISVKYLPPMIQNELLQQSTTEKKSEKKCQTEFSQKSKLSYREIEIETIIARYKELKSSYKVADELNISQSKVIRTVNKYLKK